MKKILAILLAMALVLSLAACGSGGKEPKGDDVDAAKSIKVGAILVGDETEGYTLAHMDGMEGAVEALKKEGYDVTLEYKKKVPEDTSVETNANNLIAGGCDIIITNSYGHQFNFGSVIEQNPDVTFVAMTGDFAAISGKRISRFPSSSAAAVISVTSRTADAEAAAFLNFI